MGYLDGFLYHIRNLGAPDVIVVIHILLVMYDNADSPQR